MKGYNKKLGQWGEQLAARFLSKKGYTLIDHNYYTRRGEIDLICVKDNDIVFVEVKTRTSRAFGYGEETVTEFKYEKAWATIEKYLQKNKTDLNPRYDVVVVEFEGIEPRFIHYEAVEI